MASHWVQLTKWLEPDFFSKFLVKFKKRRDYKNYRVRQQLKNGYKQLAIFIHDSEKEW